MPQEKGATASSDGLTPPSGAQAPKADCLEVFADISENTVQARLHSPDPSMAQRNIEFMTLRATIVPESQDNDSQLAALWFRGVPNAPFSFPDRWRAEKWILSAIRDELDNHLQDQGMDWTKDPRRIALLGCQNLEAAAKVLPEMKVHFSQASESPDVFNQNLQGQSGGPLKQDDLGGRVLEAMKRQGRILMLEEVQEATGAPIFQVANALRDLEAKGLVKEEGDRWFRLYQDGMGGNARPAPGSMEEAIERNRARQADLKVQYRAFVQEETKRLENESGAGGFRVPTYKEWLDRGLAKPTEPEARMLAETLDRDAAPEAIRNFQFGTQMFREEMKTVSLDLQEWAAQADPHRLQQFLADWRESLADPNYFPFRALECNQVICARVDAVSSPDGLDMPKKYAFPSAEQADAVEAWLVQTRPDFKAAWQKGNLDDLLRTSTNKALAWRWDRVSLDEADDLADSTLFEALGGQSGEETMQRYGKDYNAIRQVLASEIYGEAEERYEGAMDRDAERDADEMDSERIAIEGTLYPDQPQWRE